MSNHFSAARLEFRGDDRRLDLTDLFVFRSADAPIPAPVTGPESYPGAAYRINIDNDGDNHADLAFTFVFSQYQDGEQTGTVWYAIGPDAPQPRPSRTGTRRGHPCQL